jgi:ferredoxin
MLLSRVACRLRSHPPLAPLAALARRGRLSRSARASTAASPPASSAELVSVTFVEHGQDVEVTAEPGKSLLEVAHENEIELEGACDGSLACSTCHVILEQEVFDKLPPIDDEEMDMLDLAFGLCDTSRLGCQVKLTAELAGMRAIVPDSTHDMSPPKV